MNPLTCLVIAKNTYRTFMWTWQRTDPPDWDTLPPAQQQAWMVIVTQLATLFGAEHFAIEATDVHPAP